MAVGRSTEIGSTSTSCRLASVRVAILGIVVCAVITLATNATPALAAAGEGCPNEQVRGESKIDPATDQHYSFGLLECRGYEMVSPLDKQAHNANGVLEYGLPVAPNGNNVGFGSEGDFAEPEDYRVNEHPANVYQAQRGAAGWKSTSSFAPRALIDDPFVNGIDGDFSPDLRSEQLSCGENPSGDGEPHGTSVVCATRKSGGAWEQSPFHKTLNGNIVEGFAGFEGASSNLSRVFVQPGNPLLATDKIFSVADGLYEIELSGPGAGTSEELRLVNVGEHGENLGFDSLKEGPLIGDFRPLPKVEGSSYHAVSESGETVFFSAAPETGPNAEVQEVYARIDREHTTEVSKAECTRCEMEALEGKPESSEPKPATFQGASADGSKVFFTTEQQLVNSDTNQTTDLYEYDFDKPPGENLVLISESPTEGVGAEVLGMLRSSSDGSHVYFAAQGVLTSEPNKNSEAAQPGANNLYGYDTVTGKIKFVGDLLGDTDSALWGGAPPTPGEPFKPNDKLTREVQTTPDGRFLVFSSGAQLAGDLNKEGIQTQQKDRERPAVYRYDFDTGELTWISHGAPGFKVESDGEAGYKGEGLNTVVQPLNGAVGGADASIDDENRAISGCPHAVTEDPGEQHAEEEECPEGTYDGEYIVFTTTEKLQTDDENGNSDVYLWHNGTVSMISDGQGARVVSKESFQVGKEAAISATGSDIFFTTEAQLVGQDTDPLLDVYDARVDGGFPAPPNPTPCSGEACQGTAASPPSFGSATSSFAAAGGNLPPPGGAVLSFKVPAAPAKPLTRAQKLAAALKACKGKPKKKRAACEAQAKKKYGTAKAKAKKSNRRGK
jgi:hypothetical protein